RYLGLDGRPRGLPPAQSAAALPGQFEAFGASQAGCAVHALPARASRRGGDRRSDRWPAIGGIRRSRESPARPESHPGLVPCRRALSLGSHFLGSHLESRASIYATMTGISTDVPVRAPAAISADDTVLPFAVEALDLRGRVVRLGPAVDTILRSHAYPAPVAKLLGEAIALTVLLGSVLQFEGRFILQTQTDGPVSMLVVDFRTPDSVRGCARFDRDRIAAATSAGKDDPGALLGRGHLAMTIDQGPEMSRYQGLVALEGKDLEHAAHEYFLRSEQIPTRVRLAVAEELRADADGARHRWRAGGLLLQFLPKAPERARQPDLDPGDAPPGVQLEVVGEDDAWVEGRSLVATIEDIELLDPELSAE